jgi:hypothetical protein
MSVFPMHRPRQSAQRSPTEHGVAAALGHLLSHSSYKKRAAVFGARYADFDPSRAADVMVEDIETLIRRTPQTTAG